MRKRFMEVSWMKKAKWLHILNETRAVGCSITKGHSVLNMLEA